MTYRFTSHVRRVGHCTRWRWRLNRRNLFWTIAWHCIMRMWLIGTLLELPFLRFANGSESRFVGFFLALLFDLSHLHLPKNGMKCTSKRMDTLLLWLFAWAWQLQDHSFSIDSGRKDDVHIKQWILFLVNLLSQLERFSLVPICLSSVFLIDPVLQESALDFSHHSFDYSSNHSKHSIQWCLN
jgi:hypothetical protein